MPAAGGGNSVSRESNSSGGCRASASADVTVCKGVPSSQLTAKPKPLLMPCKQPESPVFRTFGNIVRNILFGPERDITAANTVVATYQDSDDDCRNSALECTIYELKGATAALLSNTSPALTASCMRSVFSNDLAVLALIEALRQHGGSPVVVDRVAYLAKSLAIEHRISLVPITALHVQLAWALEDAAWAVQCSRSYATAAAKDGVAAVHEASAAAAVGAAMLAAAAPTELLMPHLDRVEQIVIAAGTSAGCFAAESNRMAAYRRSGRIVSAVQLLDKTRERLNMPCPAQLDPDSLEASLACSPGRAAKPVRLWQQLRSWKCLQVLAVALVDEDPGTRDLAQTVLQDMVQMTSQAALIRQLDVAQFAAEAIAALDRVCRMTGSREDVRSTLAVAHIRSRGDTPGAAGSACVTAQVAAEALDLLMSLLLRVCTTLNMEVAELLTSELLQLDQQKVYAVQPEQLKVVQVLNKALGVILQARDDAAASAACSLIMYLVSAAEALRSQLTADAYKPTASSCHQWSSYHRSSDRYRVQVPKLLTRHFPQLKAVKGLMKQSITQHDRPSCMADVAACLCCGVLPQACEDWEARVATAVILQPRHGMNSSAVFEREQSTTAGLFSSRRLRKLVKVKNRGVVT